MDGQQQFSLVRAYSGVVSLSGQLGVLVDEPRLPQHVGCTDFYLGGGGGQAKKWLDFNASCEN